MWLFFGSGELTHKVGIFENQRKRVNIWEFSWLIEAYTDAVPDEEKILI